MKQFRTTTKAGRIVSFNRHTASGVLRVGRTRYPFEVTSFQSRYGSRYPQPGETVEAVFSADGKRLVSVWASEDLMRRRA